MLNSDYSYIIDPQFQWFYEFREFNPDIEIAGVFFTRRILREKKNPRNLDGSHRYR